MSWSFYAKGNKAAVVEQVRKVKCNYTAADEAQSEKAKTVVLEEIEASTDNTLVDHTIKVFNVSASGHAGADGNRSLTISFGYEYISLG